MDTFEQTKQAYQKSAVGLEKYWNNSGTRTRHIELAIKLSKSERPAVLELGCGSGRDAAEIVLRSSDYVGIDYSHQLIEIAKKKAPQGKFVVGDIVTAPYPSSRDVIIAFASVLHLTSQQLNQVLSKAYASLRQGGIIYINTKAGRGKTTKRDDYGTRTYYLYNSADIQELAGERFKVVHDEIEHIREQDWTELALKRQ
jgi:SAM-dependent methyltransferase